MSLKDALESLSFRERLEVMSFCDELRAVVAIDFSGWISMLSSSGNPIGECDKKANIPVDFVKTLYGYFKEDKFRTHYLVVRSFRIITMYTTIILWKCCPTNERCQLLSVSVELPNSIKKDAYLYMYMDNGVRIRSLSFQKAIGLNFVSKDDSPVWKKIKGMKKMSLSYFWWVNRYDKIKYLQDNDIEYLSMCHIGMIGNQDCNNEALKVLFQKFSHVKKLKLVFSDVMKFSTFPKYSKELCFPNVTNLKIRRVMKESDLSNFINNLSSIFPKLAYLEYRQKISSKWLEFLLQKEKLQHLECAGIVSDYWNAHLPKKNESLICVKMLALSYNELRYALQFINHTCSNVQTLQILLHSPPGLDSEIGDQIRKFGKLKKLILVGGGDSKISRETIEKMDEMSHLETLQLVNTDDSFLGLNFENLREFMAIKVINGIEEFKVLSKRYLEILGSSKLKHVELSVRKNVDMGFSWNSFANPYSRNQGGEEERVCRDFKEQVLELFRTSSSLMVLDIIVSIGEQEMIIMESKY